MSRFARRPATWSARIVQYPRAAPVSGAHGCSRHVHVYRSPASVNSRSSDSPGRFPPTLRIPVITTVVYRANAGGEERSQRSVTLSPQRGLGDPLGLLRTFRSFHGDIAGLDHRPPFRDFGL